MLHLQQICSRRSPIGCKGSCGAILRDANRDQNQVHEIIRLGLRKSRREQDRFRRIGNDFRHRQHSMRTIFGGPLILCSLCVLVKGSQAVLDSQAVDRRETAISFWDLKGPCAKPRRTEEARECAGSAPAYRMRIRRRHSPRHA